jgi:threonine dehydratase
VNLATVLAARERIAGGIVATPIVPALALPRELSHSLHLKLENTQRTGSFKDRGALNRLLQLSPGERARGLVTASAGNHAQAVAYHGQRLGMRVEVVMPEQTPLIKVLNTQRFGAGVRFHGATLSEAMEEARRLEAEEQRVFIHAYDDEAVIAGQGTIGLELLEQLPELTVVVVPIGGGGLISGIAVAIKELRPDIRIYGVEAAAAPSATASLREGRPVHIESTETIADGIAVKRVGELTFSILQRLVDGVVVVDEAQIASAVHLLLEHQKLLAEGAGATPLAAILAGLLPLRPADEVVMVLSGGNIDVNLMERIVDRGRVDDGRLTRLAVTVPDRPGNLARLTWLVAQAGANVLEVAHTRAFAEVSVRQVEIAMQLETRSAVHRTEIIAKLEGEGYVVRRAG